MNKLFFLFILWLTKLISFLITVLYLGQASNFPGKLALTLKKDLLKKFDLKVDCKIILISGTNGKSTSCGLLANILSKTGKRVIYNKSGANLLSGIVTTFSHYSNIFGKLNYDFIILEVDEATLPLITLQIKPNVIAITNFFRDQLDRFGELDTTVKLIEKGIYNTNAIIVLNADDPRVAFIETKNKKIYYGIYKDVVSSHSTNNNWLLDPEEATYCPKCRSNFDFLYKTLAHLGDYKCSNCNIKRPDVNFLITDYKTDYLSTNFHLAYDNQKQNFFIPFIGVFNLYNSLCAIAVAKTTTEITPVQIQKGLQSYSTIFGRGEKITVKTPHQSVSTAWVYLIKNPTGTTEVLKALLEDKNARFLIAINDNFADGRDISWLWDARFDLLKDHKKEIFISGKRASDMALRLKYANVNSNQIKINEKIENAIKEASESIKENETLYVLPTYTVLLEMQKKEICKEQPLN